jgi:hypothetical protein
MAQARHLLGMILATSLAVAIVNLPAVAGAWTQRLEGERGLRDRAPAVTAHPSGDYLTAADGDVSRIEGASGARLWRTRLFVADLTNFLGRVTSDASGDVVVTATRTDANGRRALIVKLDGATGAVVWSREFSGTAFSSNSSVGPVAVDAAGDVVAAGTTHFIAEDVLVLKLDGASGAVEWASVIPGPGVGTDQGIAMALDANGDVAVAGDSTVGGTGRFAVIKVAGLDGALRWRFHAGAASETGQAYTVAFDAAGNVLAGGAVSRAPADFSFAVVKVDGASGAEIWQRFVDGDTPGIGGESASDLAVDAEGGVIAVGRLLNESTSWDLFAIRFAADGGETWRREVTAPDTLFDDAEAVALVGDVAVVAGAIDGTTFDQTRFLALGLDATDGAEFWRVALEGDADGRDRATGVTVGVGGSIVVAGQLANRGSREDGVLLRLDLSGAEHWRRVINETVPEDDVARAVAADSSGDVIAVGDVGTADGARDFTVVKLARDDGAPLWKTAIDGALGEDDEANAVAVGAAGDVVAAGRTVDAPGRFPRPPFDPGAPPTEHLLVVKLDGGDGGEVWRNPVPFGPAFVAARDVALDPAGDVLALAWLGDFASALAVVVKLDGATGSEIWRRGVGASAARSDPPAAGLEVDAAGDVVAAAQGVVTKLDGASGEPLWSSPLEGFTGVESIALGPQGDAFVAGFLASFPRAFVAARIDGKDGTVVWRVEVGAGHGRSIGIDPSGDPIVAGILEGGAEVFAVAKLNQASGAIHWRRLLSKITPGTALDLALDSSGDVFAAGRVTRGSRGDDWLVVKLVGERGQVRWRRFLDVARGDDEAVAIALDPEQSPAVAGHFTGPDSSRDFGVTRFDGRSGLHRTPRSAP